MSNSVIFGTFPLTPKTGHELKRLVKLQGLEAWISSVEMTLGLDANEFSLCHPCTAAWWEALVQDDFSRAQLVSPLETAAVTLTGWHFKGTRGLADGTGGPCSSCLIELIFHNYAPGSSSAANSSHEEPSSGELPEAPRVPGGPRGRFSRCRKTLTASVVKRSQQTLEPCVCGEKK